MTADVDSRIATVHDSDIRLVAHVTGGGTSAIAALLSVPGASRTVLEATIPYSSAALRDIVGDGPDGACSEATAVAMAEAALGRAAALADAEGLSGRPVGLGCTAALDTDPPRRGADRAHLAVATPDGVSSTEVSLDTIVGRTAQEKAVSDAVIGWLADLAARSGRSAGDDGDPQP